MVAQRLVVVTKARNKSMKRAFKMVQLKRIRFTEKSNKAYFARTGL